MMMEYVDIFDLVNHLYREGEGRQEIILVAEIFLGEWPSGEAKIKDVLCRKPMWKEMLGKIAKEWDSEAASL